MYTDSPPHWDEPVEVARGISSGSLLISSALCVGTLDEAMRSLAGGIISLSCPRTVLGSQAK